MKSNFFLFTTGCLIASTATVYSAKQKQRPNIIVILADDLGSNDVGFNGCKDIPTPNIDRIANGGVKCSNAYVSAPYSGPSRAGLMTGRYQQRFGAEGNTEGYVESVENKLGVPTSELLLTEIMQNNGYKTAAIGKWHLGDHPTMKPEVRGTDYSFTFSIGNFSYWGFPTKDGVMIEENGKPVPSSEITYLTDDFTDKAVEFIDEQTDKNNPFFMYLSYNAPHAPFQAPQKYLDRTAHIYNNWRTVYGAMILAMDDGIGRIWDILEEKDIDDNTMIIFLSDNGGTNEAMNYPRRAFKGNMFDGGFNVPFAIYYKGVIKPGRECTDVISSLDIFPTVASAAGIDTEKECKNPLDGVDIVPYLSGKSRTKPHDELYWRVCGGMEYAVRKGDYKLVKRHDQDEHMLFNVVEDPIEMTDIAADNQALVAEMVKDYQNWDKQLMTPRWEDLHAPHQVEDLAKWKTARLNALHPDEKKRILSQQ